MNLLTCYRIDDILYRNRRARNGKYGLEFREGKAAMSGQSVVRRS
ncbi:MAG: hypothetical protein Q7N50_14780 [Armatimonadota bacterium]|nr:hypothetical protein [Armatimonadota bacterium]